MIEIKKKHLDCECNTFHRIHPFYFTRIVVQIDDRISNVSEHDYAMLSSRFERDVNSYLPQIIDVHKGGRHEILRSAVIEDSSLYTSLVLFVCRSKILLHSNFVF